MEWRNGAGSLVLLQPSLRVGGRLCRIKPAHFLNPTVAAGRKRLGHFVGIGVWSWTLVISQPREVPERRVAQPNRLSWELQPPAGSSAIKRSHWPGGEIGMRALWQAGIAALIAIAGLALSGTLDCPAHYRGRFDPRASQKA